MDCILCSSVDSPTSNAKNVSLNELGILSGQKFVRSLCQLLDLPPLQFQDKFLQPDIKFCSPCAISLSNIWILLDQLEQLQKQISEVRSHVTKLITDALTNDNASSNQTSSHILRTQISKVLNLQGTNQSIEATETVDDSLAMAIASISDTPTPTVHEHILPLETEPYDDDDEEISVSVSQEVTAEILNTEKYTEIPIPVSANENNAEMTEEVEISPAWSPVSVTVDSESDGDDDKSTIENEPEAETTNSNSSPKLIRKGERRTKQTFETKEVSNQKIIENTKFLKVSLTRVEDELKGQSQHKTDQKGTKQKYILRLNAPMRNRNTKTRSKPSDSKSMRMAKIKGNNGPEKTKMKRKYPGDAEEDLDPSEPKPKKKMRGRPKSVEEEIKTVPCTFTDCSEKFRSVLSRKHHLRVVHGVKPQVLQCSHCQKIFKKRHLLDTHVRIHTGEKPFVCEICGKGFRSEKFLSTHQTVHSEERPCPCPQCPKAFTSKHTLSAHMRTHTGEKPFVCDLCGERFIRSNDLTKHRNNSHGDELNLEPYKCQVCFKIYATQYYLIEHVRVAHSGDARVSCQLCSFRCDRMSRLKLHMLSHTAERPFQCTQCKKNYKYKAQLDVHMRMHTGEKPFKCKSCPRAFTELVNLKRHEELHSDSKSYQCHLCGKSFSVQRYLTYHLKNSHPQRRNISPRPQSINIVKLRDSKVGRSQGKGQDHEKVKGRRRGKQNHKVSVEEGGSLGQGQGQIQGPESRVEVIEVLEVVPELEHVQLEVYGVDLLR